jgi:hypothetical protein
MDHPIAVEDAVSMDAVGSRPSDRRRRGGDAPPLGPEPHASMSFDGRAAAICRRILEKRQV